MSDWRTCFRKIRDALCVCFWSLLLLGEQLRTQIASDTLSAPMTPAIAPKARRMLGASGRVALALAIAGALLSSRATAITPPSPPFATCTFSSASPLVVPMATTFGAVFIDPGCQYVYLTNSAQNRVEVYSLQTQSFEAPIPVGLSPMGMDVTSSGTLMYVANTGEHTVSVVDLTQRTELRKISIPFKVNLPDFPYQIAITVLNNALITTTVPGCSGKCGQVFELNLSTDGVMARTDYDPVFESADTSSRTRLRASGDRLRIVLVEGGSSAGAVHVYNSLSNAFSKRNLESFVADVSLNSSGSRIMVTRGAFLLDPSLSVTGTIASTQTAQSGGSALHPTMAVGYRAVDSKVEILDLDTYLKVGERALGASVSTAADFNVIGRMDISDDGTVLAVITNTGFSVVRPFPLAPETVNLVRNADFAGGVQDWHTFVSPDPSSFEGGIVGGVLQFNRHSPPGPGSQSLVYQNTGQPLPALAPLAARFSLGNSSTVAKTMTVILGDLDGSDPQSCTFVVPAGSPLATYRMVARTAEPWCDAARPRVRRCRQVHRFRRSSISATAAVPASGSACCYSTRTSATCMCVRSGSLPMLRWQRIECDHIRLSPGRTRQSTSMPRQKALMAERIGLTMCR